MATMTDCFFLNDNQKSVTVDNSQTVHDNRYSNLNLNQSLKCLDISPIHFNNKLYDNKHFGSAVSDNIEGIKNPSYLYKPSKISNFSNCNEIEDSKKPWKKNISLNTINDSTLSLHIVAYKNSVETDSFNGCKNKDWQKGKSDSIKNEKQIFTAAKFVFLNPFEFSRQENEGVKVPEVSKFKASQRLLNPNKASKNVTMPPKKGKTAAGHVKCDKIPEGTIFKGSYKREFVVGKEFAQGGFGRICDAKLVGKSEKLIIKLEPSGNGPLFTEMHVFQRILRPEMLEAFKRKQKLTHLGLPQLVDSGMQDDIRFLIMPKYTHCLDHVIKESRSALKLDNVVEVLICVCNALKYIHENDYVHADIKAANIMMNKKNGFNEAYLIDFGLARKVGTVVEKEDKKKAHDGTALFTSVDAHRGCGFTFRGDVEILGHNAIFWLTKTLPWQDIFNEDATIKMKNEQLVEVRAAKEDLLSNLSTNIKKYVSDSSSASVVQLLYKASQIEINVKPDFDVVIKSLSTINKVKKRVAESDSDDAPQSSTARRGRKPAAAAEEVPPSSSRSTRKKKSESDVEELDPPVIRKAKIAAKKEEEPTPIATKSRRGKQNAADSKLSSSCSTKSRARQTSENEIIPGLSTKRAGRAAMPSYQEEIEEESDEEESDEEEYEPLPPQKSNRRTAPTPKIRARSKIEATPITSTRSRIQSHEVLPILTPSSRIYPYVNSSLPSPVKKASHKPLTDNQPTKIPTPQLSASESRTRSFDKNLFSPRIPSASNYEQYYKGTEPKPKTPLAKCRSRSVENSPPNSPEFRIQAIPPPQGCNII